MKKIVLLVLLMIFAVSTNILSEDKTVWTEKWKVTTSRGTETFNVLWTNLNNPKVSIIPTLAGDKVGMTAPLSQIVKSQTDSNGTAVAGINGSFFNAYADFQPTGTLILDGKVAHIGNSGSIVTFDEANHLQVEPLYIAIEGGINNQWEWPNNWYAWNINHYYTDLSASMIFDSNYGGPKPQHTFTGIVVDKGIVKLIKKGTFEIPKDGFLLLTNDENIISKFKVGYQAAYRTKGYVNDYTTSGHKDTPIDLDWIQSAIGAGPTLVKGGKNVVNPAAEGFTEAKITTISATRSLIGVNAKNEMALLVVGSATMKQMAEIALKLGLVEAMTLDGGGSSGLYYHDQYLAEPGRNLSNGLVIKVLKTEPIKVTLNKIPLFFDEKPFTLSNRTMVPLRQIVESLGATISYDENTGRVTVKRYQNTLVLKNNWDKVIVNGTEVALEVPVTTVNGRTYVPVRFISEYLGAFVEWVGDTKTVEITAESVENLLKEAEALTDTTLKIQKYEAILALDANQLTALKALGNLYNQVLKDSLLAIPYFQRILALEPDNTAILGTLGWAYYNVNDYVNSIHYFAVYAAKLPNDYRGYYGIASCYASFQMNEVEKAKEYFQKTLDRNPSEDVKTVAMNYIKSHE